MDTDYSSETVSRLRADQALSTSRRLAPVARAPADRVAAQVPSERVQSTLFFEALRSVV